MKGVFMMHLSLHLKNIRFFNDYSDRDSIPFVAEV